MYIITDRFLAKQIHRKLMEHSIFFLAFKRTCTSLNLDVYTCHYPFGRIMVLLISFLSLCRLSFLFPTATTSCTHELAKKLVRLLSPSQPSQ